MKASSSVRQQYSQMKPRQEASNHSFIECHYNLQPADNCPQVGISTSYLVWETRVNRLTGHQTQIPSRLEVFVSNHDWLFKQCMRSTMLKNCVSTWTVLAKLSGPSVWGACKCVQRITNEASLIWRPPKSATSGNKGKHCSQEKDKKKRQMARGPQPNVYNEVLFKFNV